MVYPQKLKGSRYKLSLGAFPFYGKLYDGEEVEIIHCCGSTNLVWDYLVRVVKSNEELRVNDSLLTPNEHQCEISEIQEFVK